MDTRRGEEEAARAGDNSTSTPSAAAAAATTKTTTLTEGDARICNGQQQQSLPQTRSQEQPNMSAVYSEEGTDAGAQEGDVEKLAASLSLEDRVVRVETPNANGHEGERAAVDAVTGDECDKRAPDATAVPEPSSPSSAFKPGMEPALIDALRNPRDRIFISKHERDFEERIKDESCQQWELPLMNTYQRLLVHKVADHFNLLHNLDPTTKAIVLNKQETTAIPEKSLVELVECERLSEPSFTLVSPQSLASGPSSVATNQSIKIMKRDVSRSQSPRVLAGDDSKDRRVLTMAEKEIKYREARQRIFGEDDSGETAGGSSSSSSNSNNNNKKSISSLTASSAQVTDVAGSERPSSERGHNLSTSSPPSPSFVRSTIKPYATVRTSATPPLQDPYHFSSQNQMYTNPQTSAGHQYMYGHPGMSGQPLAQYPSGGNYAQNYANPGQYRPPYYFQQQAGPSPYASWSGPSQHDEYNSNGSASLVQTSSSASSRSTSISTDAESVAGGEGSGSSETRSGQRSGPSTPLSYVGGVGNGAPTAPPPFANQPWYPYAYHQGSQDGSVAGNYGYPVWLGPTGVPAQTNAAYGGNNQPALHHRHSTGASGRENCSNAPDVSQNAWGSVRPSQYLTRAPYQSGQGSSPSPSVSPTAQLSYRPPSPTNSISSTSIAPAGSGGSGGFGRGRRGDRALFDPNAPQGTSSPLSPASSTGQGERRLVGKSASAGALQGNGINSPAVANSSRVVSHPSLPRRPDWALGEP